MQTLKSPHRLQTSDRETEKFLSSYEHRAVNTEKQNDKSFLRDGLLGMIRSVGMGLVNFSHFYHHFLMVHINLSSLPKRIQQELS